MNTPSHSHGPARGIGRHAFTVVELMVAISVMTLIVVVLYRIFDQTQRAMRSNSAQVDVSEGGRAAMELIARDLEQMTVSPVPGSLDFFVGLLGPPSVQPLIPTNTARLNFREELFFTSEFNKQRSAVGYRVVPFTNGVGMLYRFVTNVPTSYVDPRDTHPQFLFHYFTNYARTNYPGVFQRVTDGVVHFRVSAYDSWGLPMNEPTPTTSRPTLRYATLATNIVMVGDVALMSSVTTNLLNVGVFKYPGWASIPDLTAYFFTNVVPAYLEVELGILEPQVVDRWKSMPNAQMAANYLARQAGKVTLFQQRIPVRTAVPLVPVLIP